MRLRGESSVRDGGSSVGLHDNVESDHLNMDVAEDLDLVDTLVIDSDQLFDLSRTLACCLLSHKLTDVGDFREMGQEATVGSRHVETHLLDKVGGLDSCWGGSSSRRGMNCRAAVGGRRGTSLVGAESRRVMFDSKGNVKGMDQRALSGTTSGQLLVLAIVDSLITNTIGQSSLGHVLPSGQVGADLPVKDVGIASLKHATEDRDQVLDNASDSLEFLCQSNNVVVPGLLNGSEDLAEDGSARGLDRGCHQVEP